MVAFAIDLEGIESLTVGVEVESIKHLDSLSRLPLPFMVTEGEKPVSWKIVTRTGVLDDVWPGKARVLAIYRPGGTEPFPWILEAMSSNWCLIWLLDEVSGERAKMEVDRESNTIELTQEPHGGRWLTRIVKQIFSAHLLYQGWVPLHASAFSADGRVIVCAGDRGNGKSTLAFLAAVLKKVSYLADDLVLIRPAGGLDWDVLGWPGRLAVRRGLLNQVLSSCRLEMLENEFRRGLASDANHPRGERLAIDPDEFVAKFGVRYVGHLRAPVRLAHLRTRDGGRPRIIWRKRYLDPSIEAQGYDIRYLVDTLGLFGRSADRVSGGRQLVYNREIETSELVLPYDVTSVLDSIWFHFLNE